MNISHIGNSSSYISHMNLYNAQFMWIISFIHVFVRFWKFSHFCKLLSYPTYTYNGSSRYWVVIVSIKLDTSLRSSITGKFLKSWIESVVVLLLKKLAKPITLEEIKKNKELSHLSLIKQSRLSVMPIDSKSWKILNKMGKV